MQGQRSAVELRALYDCYFFNCDFYSISKITKFKLVHAHLTVDYVSSIFPLRDNKSDRLKWHFALKMFEEAVKNNINIIFTKTYDISDNLFLKKLISMIKRYKGKIFFVKLSCKPELLYKRVT